MTTPLEIDIAYWYYARRGDYGDRIGDENLTAPAVQAALICFVEAGLLKRHEPNADVPQRYISTEALCVYVEALCRVPWPVQRWVIPDGSLPSVQRTGFRG